MKKKPRNKKIGYKACPLCGKYRQVWMDKDGIQACIFCLETFKQPEDSSFLQFYEQENNPEVRE